MDKFKGDKVVLIGNGTVGSSYVFSLANQSIVDELVTIDLDTGGIRGDAMDSEHATSYSSTTVRVKVDEYSDCHDADLVVIRAGAAQKPRGTCLDLVPGNSRVFKSIVDEIMASKFDDIFLVTTNSADILAYATWKFSGLFKERVISSGTILDSVRFRLLLSRVFDVVPHSADAQTIGEHSNTELSVWLHANIAGQSLKTLFEQRLEGKAQIEQIFVQTCNATYNIIQAKGATYCSVAMGLVRVTEAIFRNEDAVLTVSALLEDEYEEEDIYIGVPAVISGNDIRNIVGISLNDEEQSKFTRSARILKDIMAEAEELK